MLKLVESQYTGGSPDNGNQRYAEFVDEEQPHEGKLESKRRKRRRHLGKKMIGQARRIIVEPIERSKLYQATKIEFANQSRQQRFSTYVTAAFCLYWFLNCSLGLYILYSYPQLKGTHPNIFKYLLIFSTKWLLACFGSLNIMLLSCFVAKVFCRCMGVCKNTIGAFPVVYLAQIFVLYMYSLYYGVQIIREIYQPENKDEEDTYHFHEEKELFLLKAFVFNEVIVGAIIILQIIQTLCCGKITKSRHLNEIEGEGFGVDEAEVRRIQQELQESRLRTESLRKGSQITPANLQMEMIQELKREEFARQRSASQDPESLRKLGGAQSPTMKTAALKKAEMMSQSQKSMIGILPSQSTVRHEEGTLKLQLHQSQMIHDGEAIQEIEQTPKIDNYQSNQASTNMSIVQGSRIERGGNRTNEQSFERQNQQMTERESMNQQMILQQVVEEEEKSDLGGNNLNKEFQQ